MHVQLIMLMVPLILGAISSLMYSSAVSSSDVAWKSSLMVWICLSSISSTISTWSPFVLCSDSDKSPCWDSNDSPFIDP